MTEERLNSPTLKAILTHWVDQEFDAVKSPIELHFDIEAFCRENDKLIAEVRRLQQTDKILQSTIDSLRKDSGEMFQARLEQEKENASLRELLGEAKHFVDGRSSTMKRIDAALGEK